MRSLAKRLSLLIDHVRTAARVDISTAVAWRPTPRAIAAAMHTRRTERLTGGRRWR